MKAVTRFPRRLAGILAMGTFGLAAEAGAAIIHVSPALPLRIPFDSSLDIDLNGDGVLDLNFSNNSQDIFGHPLNGTRTVAYELLPLESAYRSADLDPEVWIGSSVPEGYVWTGEQVAIATCFNAGGLVCLGSFTNGLGYLGVEFQIEGATHYGWMALLAGEDFAIRMDIVDWAYESLPNTPIRAGQIPEPSALLLSFLGILARIGHRSRSILG
jgi:hypothetical protein